jgi:uncharacterized protein (TIRG00374 family)
MKKQILFWSRILISIGLVGYFLWFLANKYGSLGIAWDNIIQAFGEASLIILLLPFSLHAIGFLLTSARWQILLKAQNVDAPYWKLFLYYLKASFFNIFLFSTIGGDAVRFIDSKKLAGSGSISLLVVIIERLTGLMALAIISAFGVVFYSGKVDTDKTTALVFLTFIVAGFILLTLIMQPRCTAYLQKKFNRFLSAKKQQTLNNTLTAVQLFYKKPWHIGGAIIISILFQLNNIVYFYFIARALSLAPDFYHYLLNTPILIFLLMVIPAVNGIGVRTVGFKELLLFKPSHAMVGELIDLGLKVVYGLIGGIVFLFYKKK